VMPRRVSFPSQTNVPGEAMMISLGSGKPVLSSVIPTKKRPHTEVLDDGDDKVAERLNDIKCLRRARIPPVPNLCVAITQKIVFCLIGPHLGKNREGTLNHALLSSVLSMRHRVAKRRIAAY